LIRAFETYGPFPLRREGEYVARDALRDFWDEVSEIAPGLEDAVGVYILTVKHGNSSKPWYVGKTDKGFRERIRGHADSRKLFAGLAGIAPNGRVELIFLARRLPSGGGFKKPSKNNLPSVDALERLLIGSCFAKNDLLLNVQRMSVYKGLKVPGYMNGGKGKPSSSASSLRKLLN
jgi:hypothetical protein